MQRNPALAPNGMDLEIYAVLKKQSQAAELLRSRLMAAPARGALSATPSGNRIQNPIATAKNPSRTNGGKPAVYANGTSLDVSPSPAIINTLACAKAAPAPLIDNINGQKTGIIFSSDAMANSFVVMGCNFGNTPGSLQIVGGTLKQPVTIIIDKWTEGGIAGHISSDLCGEKDEDSVRLRFIKSNNVVYEFPGYKFYMSRAERKLLGVAKTKVQFGPWFDPCPQNGDCEYRTGHALDDPTFAVTRNTTNPAAANASGVDRYTLDELDTGWAVSSVQLWTWNGPQNYSVNLEPQKTSINLAPQKLSSWRAPQTIEVRYAFQDWTQKNMGYDATYWTFITVAGPRDCHPGFLAPSQTTGRISR